MFKQPGPNAPKKGLEAEAENAAKRLKEIEAKVRSVRAELNELENVWMEARHAHRCKEMYKKRNRDRTSCAGADLKESYKVLQTARQEVAIIQEKARSMEANLGSARSDLFYWNKVWKAAGPAYDPAKGAYSRIDDAHAEPDKVKTGVLTARRMKPGPNHYYMEDHRTGEEHDNSRNWLWHHNIQRNDANGTGRCTSSFEQTSVPVW
ncbi:hypothetical protein BGZ51_000661 [Haplosporangium sp. Z 767]|nr:hypothetical protein BGZ51_000661 [Haplosporangium sp. Z 767]KAF9190367.1 hypothetical protein BGZ50_000255 [Haplosporangium sp. Z 11]